MPPEGCSHPAQPGATAAEHRGYNTLLLDWAVGSLNRRPHLFEQLFPGIWLGNESTEPLRQHRPDFVLLREPAAQNHVHARIDSFQFLENSIAVHHRQEEIQDDQPDLIVNLLEDF